MKLPTIEFLNSFRSQVAFSGYFGLKETVSSCRCFGVFNLPATSDKFDYEQHMKK
jgi:hypothetical protein